MKKMSISLKTMSYFYMIISVLLGISTFLTASKMIHFMNQTAIFLLACTFVLHQLYDDKGWNIGKYAVSIFTFTIYSIGSLCYSFYGLNELIKLFQKRKYRVLLLVLGGILIGIPMLSVVINLLGSADQVFSSFVNDFFETYFSIQSIFSIIIQFILAALFMYAFICCSGLKKVRANQINRRNGEPVLMITSMSMVGGVYLIFCFIQIIYLFLGKGVLPEGMTYAEYARQGFFQLLFVVILNLVMVLCCIKYFRESGILNFVLTVISGCTYIMIASSVYRMLLYIGVYQLTRLRVLVLWFLLLVSVLMVGVVILIYKNSFPLFHYSVLVISVFYVVFAFMRPDYQIAKYNYEHNGSIDIKALSPDALPYAVLLEEDRIEGIYDWSHTGKQVYINKLCDRYGKMNLRKYNHAYEKVFQLQKQYK